MLCNAACLSGGAKTQNCDTSGAPTWRRPFFCGPEKGREGMGKILVGVVFAFAIAGLVSFVMTD